MKTLVIYPGRFQPFHKGHAQVFQWLKNKFGDAYIATSDKVEAPKSPFNFQEKKQMMRLAGVPAGKIKQVLNPYMAKEILKDFDPKTTVLIFAVSQKDMEEDPRFSFKSTKSGKPGYLQPYAGNENKLKPFGDANKMQGYVIVTPTFTFNVLGKPATSASELRKQFVSLDNKKQKEFITDLFGKYDAEIHKLMKKKIGDMMGKTKTIKQLKEEITRKELAPMLDSFVSFASDKLGLKSMPSVRYKTGDDYYNSFAAYNPSSNELSISTANRHPMDIFRSVAHELVHHKQNEDGRLGKDIAKEGSTGSDIENEANAEAGKIMRWFAKSNPDMFGKSYVVETNTSAIGGIRGLGNVTGEVSPDGISQYFVDNEKYTREIKNITTGLYTLDLENSWLDPKGINEYQKKAVRGFKAVRGQLNEGINDPGKLKAIFLAGGPGSGKDFVMNKALVGNGLREINSDTAFEFLMKKHNLDPMMPEKERVEREIVRGRAKNITNKKEINSLTGRLGLIVNGTADDLEKIKSVKAELEDLGYDTMMVFVNTTDEVSKQRNFERGQAGVRKVPDGTDEQGNPDGSQNIRKEKWDLAQKNLGAFMNLFGKDNFTVIDNTADTRKVTPEQKEKIEADFNRVRRMAMQFAQAPLKNKRGKDWVQRRARYQGTTEVTPPRTYTKTQKTTPIEAPKSITKPSNEVMDQARRLGLSYYGFGRFGRKVGGTNKVLYHSVGGRLVKAQAMNEEKKMGNPCWKGFKAYGMKKKNGKEVPNCVPVDETFEKFMQSMGNKPSEREIGTPSLTKVYAEMTPGQHLEEKKKIKVKKKLNQEALTAPEPWGYNFGGNGIGDTFPVTRAGTPMGFGYGAGTSMGLSESIQNWMNSEKTQTKFADKYGDLWEEKLAQAALRLEEAGCGCEHTKMKKSVKKLREGNEGGVNMMGMVPVQRKDDEQQLHERGADSKGLYRSTESGAGLTRKGAKHFGIKTAVTTPPSKLDPKGKAAKRRKSFCARMGGMPGPMKDEKGRPTRKAMSLRRWNCEE